MRSAPPDGVRRTYNEPESTEVLVKASTPNIRPSCTMPTPGDAGADLITTVDVTLKPFERALVPTGVGHRALPAGYVALGASAFRAGRQSRASPCSTRLAPLIPATVAGDQRCL